MKILVVDDDPFIVQVLGLALGAMGFEDVTTARSAEQALAAVEAAEAPFECFLLDIQMPEVDGIELCEQLRERDDYRRTPILMLTAMSEREYVERSFEVGANDFITKPFETVELAARIRMAEQLHKEIVCRDEIGLPIPVEGGTLLPLPTVEFDAAMSFGAMPGHLELPTFHNYVSRLARSKFRYGGVLAVKLTEAPRHHRDLSAGDYAELLSRVADALSSALWSHRCHFTYAGSGYFLVLALTVPNAGFAKDLGMLVWQELERIELPYPTVGPNDLGVAVSRAMGTAMFETKDAEAIVEAAIGDVETALASHTRVEPNTAVGHRSTLRLCS